MTETRADADGSIATKSASTDAARLPSTQPGRPGPTAAMPAEHVLPPEEFCQLLAPGTRVGEHYVITGVLGYGGMGLVMRAHDELLMRDVALKFLQPRMLMQDSARAAMISEARAMARVKHANVVDVYAFGTHLGVPYFAMQHVPGQTAEQWFMRRSHGLREFIPLDEVIGVLDQCCAGVAAIHAMGAVHGDLKPTNVLMDDEWRVAIADFGIAMLLDGGAQRQLGGTPDYLAPEAFTLLSDASLLQRRDVFALGVMAYEFLTNERPFPSQSMKEFLSRARELPPPPSHHRPHLPLVFDRIVMDALAFDPHARTVSVDELSKQLRGARKKVSDRPVATRVVVVEDDLAFANFVRLTLEANIPGVRVTHFARGAEALLHLRQCPSDLVILDLGLPGMNGMELTAEVRARWAAAQTPILVVTAQGSAADWKVLQSLGANGFLAKPVDMSTLTAMVLRQLAPSAPVFLR